MIRIQEALAFDDVLLTPCYSECLPSDVCVLTSLTPSLQLDIPILSSAMDTVTEESMAIALAQKGGMGVLHKNMLPEKQAQMVIAIKAHHSSYKVAAAVGVGVDREQRVDLLLNAGVDALVIDTAHGHTKLVIDFVRWFKQNNPSITLIAGNIATAQAAKDLAEAGADCVKVGIGPGSICTTRVIAGIGVPSFTAILEVSNALRGTPVTVIADGGMRYSGDITKALAAGAHAVMLGSLLAGSQEAPGEIISVGNKLHKSYRGMGSLPALKEGCTDRYFQHKTRGALVPEGVEGIVPYKGPVIDILDQLVGGLRLGMGYVGAKTLEELRDRAQFIRISPNSLRENHPHTLVSTQEAVNYKA